MYNSLIRAGYTSVDDSENNSLILKQNILDTPISNIGVEPLKPTRFQQVKNKVKEFAQNRKKNLNEILTQTDKVVKKVLPTKIQELINYQSGHHIILRKCIGKLMHQLTLKMKV